MRLQTEGLTERAFCPLASIGITKGGSFLQPYVMVFEHFGKRPPDNRHRQVSAAKGVTKLSALRQHGHRGSGRLNLCAYPTLYRAVPFAQRGKRNQKRAFYTRHLPLFGENFLTKISESNRYADPVRKVSRSRACGTAGFLALADRYRRKHNKRREFPPAFFILFERFSK